MNALELKSLQAPLKAKYQTDAATALVTLKSAGDVDRDEMTCTIETAHGRIVSGLHPTAGGDGSTACSGDMLLDALVACAGVTFSAVATMMELPIRSTRITAEGDWDVRGTLGVDKSVPVGVREIRLSFDIDSDAPSDKIDKLIELTERYCVIFQTLKNPPVLRATRSRHSR